MDNSTDNSTLNATLIEANSAMNGTLIDANITVTPGNFSTEPRNTLIPDGLLAHAQFWIYVIIVPVSCTIGLVGNSLALIVFTEIARKLKQSIYRYMLALVSVDSMMLLLALVRATPYISDAIDERNGNSEGNGKSWFANIVIPVVYIDLSLATMNSMILILMSLERLVAIRTPLTAKETILAKHPIRIMSAVAGTVMLCLIPLPTSVHVRYSVDQNGTSSSSYSVVARENMGQFMQTFLVIETALFSYLPYVTLMFLNVAIPVQYAFIVRARAKTFSSSIFQTSDENQFRINTTVSIIIFMYTILNLPQMFIQTLSIIDETYSINGTEDNFFRFMSEIANLLIIVNSSIDFVIYVLRTETYRAMFREKFCRKSTRHDMDAS